MAMDMQAMWERFNSLPAAQQQEKLLQSMEGNSRLELQNQFVGHSIIFPSQPTAYDDYPSQELEGEGEIEEEADTGGWGDLSLEVGEGDLHASTGGAEAASDLYQGFFKDALGTSSVNLTSDLSDGEGGGDYNNDEDGEPKEKEESKEQKFVKLLTHLESAPPLSSNAFLVVFEMLLAYTVEYFSSPTTTSATSHHNRQDVMGPAASLSSAGESIEKNDVHFRLFEIFFSLFPLGDDNIKQLSLKTLQDLMAKHQAVKSYCWATGWLEKLLKILPKLQQETQAVLVAAIGLIRDLGQHRVNPYQLRTLFRALKWEGYEKQIIPRYWPILLTALKMIGRSEEPERSFLFDGSRETGVFLPSINKWPEKGWTFATWIRVESWVDATTRNPTLPCLFSFYSEDYSSGIEVSLNNRSMRLRVLAKGGKVSQCNLPFVAPLEERQWYYICITHEVHNLRASKIKLFVGGVLHASDSLAYPYLTDSYTHCFIGISPMSEALSVSPSGAVPTGTATTSTPFYGKMSTVYFFTAEFTEAAITYTYKLGLTGFAKYATHTPSNDKLYSHIFFAYDPLHCIDAISVAEFSPRFLLGRGRRAFLMKGTQVSFTSNIKNFLRSLGGSKVFLLPISQIDFQRHLVALDTNKEAFLPPGILAVATLTDMLTQNPKGQKEFVYYDGFRVLGHLFQHIELTQELIPHLDELRSAILPNEVLVQEIDRYVYFNWRVWQKAPLEVQLQLFTVLGEHARNNPEYCVQFINIRHILEVLKTLNNEAVPDMQSVRFKLLSIAAPLIRHQGLSSADACEVLNFFLRLPSVDDAFQIVDLLQMFCALMKKEKMDPAHQSISELFVDNEGLDVFVYLTKSSSENVRCWSLKAISILLELVQLKRKKKAPFTREHAIILKKNLQIYPLSEQCYFVLLELLLNQVVAPSIVNPLHAVKTSNSSSEASETATVFQFDNTSFISIIFETVCVTDSPLAMKRRMLEDFLFLLRENPHNRVVFLTRNRWQPWLFGLWSEYSNNEYSDVYHFLVELFLLLLFHSIHEKDGWKTIIQTHTLCLYFHERGLLNFTQFCQVVYTRVLQWIKTMDRTKTALQSGDPIVWENISHWMEMLSAYFFFSSPNAAEQYQQGNMFISTINRDEEGKWSDFTFSSHVLEFCDSIRAFVDRSPPQTPARHSQPQAQTEQLTSSASSPSLLESVIDPKRSLDNLELLLTLSLVHEVESYHAMETKRLSSDAAVRFQALISDYCKENQQILNAVSKYLKGKSKRDEEIQSLERVYQKIMARMDFTVQRLATEAASKPDVSRHITLFILSFIYQSMKQSFERKGVGADMLLSLFRDTLVHFRNSMLPENNPLSGFSEDELVDYFMKQFTYPDPDFFLMHDFETALQTAITDQVQRFQHFVEQQERYKANLFQSMAAVASEETIATENYAQHYNDIAMLTTSKARTEARYHIDAHQKAVASQKWKDLRKSTEHERGPWADPSSSGTTSWKLSQIEGSSRMRGVLKPRRTVRSNSAINNTTKPPISQTLFENNADLLSNLFEASLPKGEESNSSNYKFLTQKECDLISPKTLAPLPGVVGICPVYIYYHTTASVALPYSTTSKLWPVAKLKDIVVRHSHYKANSALELFFIDHRPNVFLDFRSRDVCVSVLKILLEIKPASLVDYYTLPSARVMFKEKLLEQWERRELSNFDYLMHLNTLAGRSYSDITQYPVFPWVIADYVSSKLDLTKPSVYRDLSRPIAIKQASQQHHLYHYSTAEGVAFYLVRLIPFMNLYLDIQKKRAAPAGADTIFSSIGAAWDNRRRELIPEFYYLPEMFESSHSRSVLPDVILPPWANNSSETFVKLNRAALESDYVSEHLHEWIDLIFGYKQIGSEAAKANNLFNPISYIDNTSQGNEHSKGKEDEVYFKGVTPQQLFNKPHPKRRGRVSTSLSQQRQPPFPVKCRNDTKSALLFIDITKDNNLILVFDDGVVAVNKVAKTADPKTSRPIKIDLDKTLLQNVPIYTDLQLQDSLSHKTGCFVLTSDGKTLIHGGKRDNTFSYTTISTGQRVYTASDHHETVSALVGSSDTKILVTGSYDTTVLVWEDVYLSTGPAQQAGKGGVLKSIFGGKQTPAPDQNIAYGGKLRHILHGHDKQVNSVALSTALGVVVSGSSDGSVIVSDLVKGRYLRTIRYPSGMTVEIVKVSNRLGHIVAYCRSRNNTSEIFVHSINGKLITRIDHDQSTRDYDELVSLESTRSSSTASSAATAPSSSPSFENAIQVMTIEQIGNKEYLLTGDRLGNLHVRDLESSKLSTVKKFEPMLKINSGITSLKLGLDNSYLFVGLETGLLIVYPFDSDTFPMI